LRSFLKGDAYRLQNQGNLTPFGVRSTGYFSGTSEDSGQRKWRPGLPSRHLLPSII
jgi:hypothetical protein